ncbi:zf-DNL-domain-containing protein [Fomitopsis betulina]|nr:zf-DNL-domain-containing protein [Fomitopsis betulina]
MNVLRQLSQRSFFCTPSASALHRVAPGVPAHLRYARPQAPSFGSQRLLSSTPPRVDETASSSSAPKSPETHDKVTFKTEEPRLSLTFTCTVTTCGTRSSHMFTRRSYERGIVIVQCPGCRNRHLIADHLGWFKESTEEGKLKTVEDLMRAKGETVRRGTLDADGVVEYTPE